MNRTGRYARIHLGNHPGTDGLIMQIHALFAIFLAESMELIQYGLVRFEGMRSIPFLSLQVYKKFVDPGHGQHFIICQNPGILVFLLLQLLNIDGLEFLLALGYRWFGKSLAASELLYHTSFFKLPFEFFQRSLNILALFDRNNDHFNLFLISSRKCRDSIPNIQQKLRFFKLTENDSSINYMIKDRYFDKNFLLSL